MIHNNILETIGKTPVIALDRIINKHGLRGKLYAKIEFLNPGMSKKDRIAKYMIEKAEADGLLRPGQTVIEATSGNTGIALAMVCAVKGYPFIAVMSQGNSPERAKMIRNYGQRVELVPQAPDSKPGQVSGADKALVEKRFEQLAKETGAYCVGQFSSSVNPDAHADFTAKEIISDVPNLNCFCDFIGTGGSFEGIARGLKKYNSKITCMKVMPDSLIHGIQGGGYFHNVPFANAKHCDGEILVSDKDAAKWRKELAETEGIAGGISSGANLAAAVKYLEKNPGAEVLFLVNDSFFNYLSVQ